MVPELMMLDDVVFDGRGSSNTGLFLQTLDGWRTTPSTKVTLTERVNGDGAHPIRDTDVQYAARTVKGNLIIVSDSRAETIAQSNALNLLLGRLVTMRVRDQDDTFCRGYVEFAWPETFQESQVFTFTFIAVDPTRRAVEAQSVFLDGAVRTGAFEYPVEYPIGYGAPVTAANTGVLVNNGDYRADAQFVVTGNFPNGFTLQSGSAMIVYTGPVYTQAPVTISTDTRDAIQSGVSRGAYLERFDDFRVPAAGTRTVVFSADGTGWCEASTRDSYM